MGDMSLRRWQALGVLIFLTVVSASAQQPFEVTKTQRIGNWTAAAVKANEPSVIVTLPSEQKNASFIVQCLTKLKRWTVLIYLPSGEFRDGTKVAVTLQEPLGRSHKITMSVQNKQTLYAFFDRDEAAVFQMVRWFTIYRELFVLLKPDFPLDPVGLDFRTEGAAEATKIPLQECKPEQG